MHPTLSAFLMKTVTKRVATNLTVLFVAILFTLGLCEGLLRILGFQPWQYRTSDVNEPTMLEPDPVLGWRNKLGNYVLPRYDASGEDVTLTFLDRGRRRTRMALTSAHEQLIFVGGSYTQGWALNDEDTFAWKVQEQYPEFDVLNYGTGGYGTYQSLLALEQELPHLSSPKHVFYGFIFHHEVRNTASGRWLRQLMEYSLRGHTELPFGTVNEKNGLQRHSPTRYLELPLRESFALVAFVERAYMKLKSWRRFNQRREITEQTMLQMKRLTEVYGAAFTVVILTSPDEPREHYLKFSRENDIHCIDCVVECTDCLYDLPRDMMIAGDGHPNAELNARWADCIERALEVRRAEIYPYRSRHDPENDLRGSKM